ncbi:hypothetical protein [Clostridium muellerianum]|nr:hypothetical protein [Clostridium muellerianum]
MLNVTFKALALTALTDSTDSEAALTTTGWQVLPCPPLYDIL